MSSDVPDQFPAPEKSAFSTPFMVLFADAVAARYRSRAANVRNASDGVTRFNAHETAGYPFSSYDTAQVPPTILAGTPSSCIT